MAVLRARRLLVAWQKTNKARAFSGQAMNSYRSVEVELHSLLTLTLDGVSGLSEAPVSLLPEKELSVHTE